MVKTLGRESFVYGLGQILNKSIGIFILPIITRAFNAQELGLIEFIAVIINIAIIFSTLGLDSALTFYFWDAKDDGESQKRFVSTTFYSTLFFALIVSGVLAISKELLEVIITNPEYTQIYYLSIITIPFMALFNVLAKISRIHKKPMIFNMITILNISLYLILVSTLIFSAKVGLAAIYLSKIASFAICGIVGFTYFKSSLNRGFHLTHFIKLVKYGVPLIPILFIGWIMKVADRYFLLQFHNMEMVGFYSVGLRLASVIGLLIGAFSLAWGPYALSIKNQENAQNIYADVLLKFTVLCFVFVLVINLLSPVLVLIFTIEKYMPVTKIIGILSLGLCFQTMYSIMAIGLNITKRTYLLSIGVGVAAIVNICCNILLVPKLFYIGSAISNCIGYLTAIILVYFISKKYYPISYNFKKLIPMFVYIGFSLSFSVYLGIHFQERKFLLIVYNFLILISYIGWISLLNIFHMNSYFDLLKTILGDKNNDV